MEYTFSNRNIKNMLISLVIEQILVMMVGIANTVVISYAGEAVISDTALMDTISYLVITALVIVDTGGAAIVSQYLGKKVKENANESTSQLVIVSFLLSLALMVFYVLFHTLILRLLFREVMSDVMAATNTYFVTMVLSYPSLRLHNSSAALYRSMRRIKATMYVSLLMNIFNITENIVGIFVLHAGVSGVAVPTLILRSVTVVIAVGLAFQGNNEIFTCWRHLFAWNRKLIGKILRIVVPNGTENGLFALGKVLVTSIVTMFGATQVAANGIASNVDQIAVLVVNVVNLATIPLVGWCIGAGEQDRAKTCTKKLTEISYLYTAILGKVVIAWLPVILQPSDVSEGTYRTTVWLVVSRNILAIAFHLTPFNLANSLRASGGVKVTMYTGTGSMVVFRLGTMALPGVPCGFGVFRVWAAMGMDWLARSMAFTIRYKNGKWRRMKTIQVSAR